MLVKLKRCFSAFSSHIYSMNVILCVDHFFGPCRWILRFTLTVDLHGNPHLLMVFANEIWPFSISKPRWGILWPILCEFPLFFSQC